MDLQVLLQKYKRLWTDWEIRSFLLLSLALQILLIMLGSLRRRTASWLIRLFIWIPYLVADLVATFALGHLADSLNKADQGQHTNALSMAHSPSPLPPLRPPTHGGGGSNVCNASVLRNDLIAFWAPFLLVHLGGPDTITAFSIEDNELWGRHLLMLVTHLSAAAYVVFRSLPNTVLLVPTALILAVGFVKYVERSWSLYLASGGGFRSSLMPPPDAGPNYAALMQEYDAIIDAGFEVDIKIVKEIEEELEEQAREATKEGFGDVVAVRRRAYNYFNTFKCIVVDLVLSFEERRESRQAFLQVKCEEAFRVIEIELNFLYDVFYTKAPVVHRPWVYVLRVACSAAILASFFMFFILEKQGFCESDVMVTYALLWGAVVVEAVSLTMLLFSDWVVVSLVDTQGMGWLAFFVAAVRERTRRCFPAWSGSMSQFNLITLCLDVPPEGTILSSRLARRILGSLAEILHVEEAWRGLIYSSAVSVTRPLRELILDELKIKAEKTTNLESIKALCERRGSDVLEKIGDSLLLRSVEDADFEESLLLWHVATTLCYYGAFQEGVPPNGANTDGVDRRELSKLLADYMMYLLVLMPAITSTVTGVGLLRYKNLRKEVTDIVGSVASDPQQACSKIWEKYRNGGGDQVEQSGQAMLSRACAMAHILASTHDRWAVIAGVWVEQLMYLACHCRGMQHAKLLSHGGELLTMVWFLMVHLGLGTQYRTEAGNARALLEER